MVVLSQQFLSSCDGELWPILWLSNVTWIG